MTKLKNELVPKRRYDGFIGEWRIEKLGNITKYTKGYAFKSSEYKKYGIRIIRVSDLDKDRIKSDIDSVFLDHDKSSYYKDYIINKDEIIITTVGSKAEMKESAVGRPIIVTNSHNYLLNQNLVKIKGERNYNNNFIYCSLLQSDYTKYIAEIERGNANQANIALNDLWEYLIKIPSNIEQKKIGEFFKHLDEMIAIQQRKIDKTKALKSAYLAEMFPEEGERVPKRRFEGFTEEWEKVRFEDILKTYSFRPYLAIPSEIGDYRVIQQGDNPVVGYSKGNPFKDYKDVVLFGDHTVSLYKPNEPFFIATDGVKILSADGIIGQYLYILLDKYQPQTEGYKRHFTILKNEYCMITRNKEEQQKIGQFFKHLDDTISIHQQKLEKLKATKQAYLHEMFV